MILLTDEEIGEIVGSCKEWFDIPDKVAKAQLKKVVEWGDEECRHPKHDVPANLGHRRECTQCWQSLLKEIELG